MTEIEIITDDRIYTYRIYIPHGTATYLLHHTNGIGNFGGTIVTGNLLKSVWFLFSL